MVTLAYRDYQGRGRVYFAESDWQDTEASFTAQSAGLMHYMITHGPNPYDVRRVINPALQ